MLKMWKVGLVALLVGCGSQEGAAPAETNAPSVVEEEAAVAVRYVLQGEVLDPWGSPVPGAEVRVLPMDSDEQQPELARAQSDDAGQYELELNGPGPFLLFARHERAGFDRVQSHVLKADGENRAPALRMAGEGRLFGRLTNAAGQPIARAKLVAYSRELLRQELFRGGSALPLDDFPLWAPRLESVPYQPGRGFQYQEDETDEGGYFELKGLIPGEYLFYSPAIGARSWLQPGRAWSTTGAESIELRSTLCTLEIAVGQDDLPGTEAELPADRRRLGAIEVFATVPTEWGPRPLMGRVMQPYGSERNVYALEPGDYVVRAVTYPPKGVWGGTMHVEGLIHLEEGETFKHFDLEFPDLKRPLGRLRVQADVPEGWDVPQTFHLLSPETGLEFECSEYTPYPNMAYGEWLDVPEGEYLIGLMPFTDFVGRSEVVEMAPCYRRIVIKAGEDVESTLHATFGATFRFELDADRFVLGRDLLMPEDLPLADQKAIQRLFAMTMGAALTIVREDGSPALNLRLREVLNHKDGERMTLLPGEALENLVPLEPGNYSLCVEAPGFETGRVQFSVESRGKTTVGLRLVRRTN